MSSCHCCFLIIVIVSLLTFIFYLLVVQQRESDSIPGNVSANNAGEEDEDEDDSTFVVVDDDEDEETTLETEEDSLPAPPPAPARARNTIESQGVIHTPIIAPTPQRRSRGRGNSKLETVFASLTLTGEKTDMFHFIQFFWMEAELRAEIEKAYYEQIEHQKRRCSVELLLMGPTLIKQLKYFVINDGRALKIEYTPAPGWLKSDRVALTADNAAARANPTHGIGGGTLSTKLSGHRAAIREIYGDSENNPVWEIIIPLKEECEQLLTDRDEYGNRTGRPAEIGYYRHGSDHFENHPQLGTMPICIATFNMVVKSDGVGAAMMSPQGETFGAGIGIGRPQPPPAPGPGPGNYPYPPPPSQYWGGPGGGGLPPPPPGGAGGYNPHQPYGPYPPPHAYGPYPYGYPPAQGGAAQGGAAQGGAPQAAQGGVPPPALPPTAYGGYSLPPAPGGGPPAAAPSAPPPYGGHPGIEKVTIAYKVSMATLRLYDVLLNLY